MMAAFCKVPLFSKNLEYFNLAIPLLFYPLLIIDLFFLPGVLGVPTRGTPDSIWDFIRNIIFLNSIHALFPFILLFRCEEIKNWIPLQKGGALGFWSRVIGIQSFFFLIFFEMQTMSSWAANNLLLEVLLSLLLFGVVTHHPLAQIRGISRLYDEKNLPTDTLGTSKVKQGQKNEKYLFLLFIWGNTLFFSLLYLPSMLPFRTFLIPYAFAVLVLLVLAIFVNFFNFPRPWNHLKLLYLVRLFAFPLSFFSPVARLVTGSSHGIESFCIYRHMQGRSSNGKYWINLPVLVIFSLIVFSIVFRYRYVSFLSWLRIESEFTSKAINSLGLSFIFTHYYIEAILYRFRKPDCREHTLPLLVSSPLNQ